VPTRFDGKVSVVTGGASGIGEGIVRRLVTEGSRCVIADVQEERGRALAQELGDSVRFVRADVSVEDDVARMVSVAVSELGGLDCLFNNAGILGVVGSLLDSSREDWDRTMAVLLTSVFLGIKYGARVMRAQGSGAIVNTASTAGVRGGLGPHAYTAAKHAVVGLTESAAVELMPAGVRVNAIAPGATVSGMTASVVAGDPTALGQVEERLAKRFGRAARPEDVAAAAVFLASDEAWYVNGACLVIDGASEVPGVKARRYFETVDD
jgi:NAD(P)-dependent dehydrogenase (short-subunit alcohol dehydrogenase family)